MKIEHNISIISVVQKNWFERSGSLISVYKLVERENQFTERFGISVVLIK